MPSATGIMEGENGVGLVVLAWQMAKAWIPAYAGMTVGVVLVVKGGFAGGYFPSKDGGEESRKAPRFAFALSTCRVWANQGLHLEGENMDTARVFFMGAAYFFWVLAAIMLVSSVFSGATIFYTAVGLFIAGLIFFVLNKVTARK